MSHLRLLRTTLRASGLLAGCVAAGAGTWSVVHDPLRRIVEPLVAHRSAGLVGLRFEDALAGLCAALLTTCALWLLVGTLIAIASHVADELSPHGTAAAALTVAADRGWPRGLRRAVAATLGVAVAAGVAGPAFAGPSPPVTAQASWAGGRGAISTGTLADSLRGLPVPDRAAGPATAGPRPPARAAAPRRQPVVIVHRGDSLWSISADLLPRRATDRDITETWHRLHRANSGRIGTDPALILPGTRLAVPELSAPDPEDPS